MNGLPTDKQLTAARAVPFLMHQANTQLSAHEACIMNDGVNTSKEDGSVRFVTDSIDLQIG